MASSSPSARPPAPRVRLGEDDGRRALLVDGVVQSIAVEPGQKVEGYWSALLPSVRPRRALLLGLGGGTLVHLLHRRFGALAIVGVEADPEVLALARADFELDRPGLEVVEADALDYVANAPAAAAGFDFICVDLFRGARLERGILGRPFLRRLEALARPGTEIVVNLFQDRRAPAAVQRLARVLAIRSTEQVGKNVIVRAGVRR